LRRPRRSHRTHARPHAVAPVDEHDAGADRGGYDPAVLLRNYAKRTKKADNAAANIIGAVSATALGQKYIWTKLGPNRTLFRFALVPE
jgi:hypothetical protein